MIIARNHPIISVLELQCSFALKLYSQPKSQCHWSTFCTNYETLLSKITGQLPTLWCGFAFETTLTEKKLTISFH